MDTGINSFNVIICGSREFQDYNLLKEKCDYYLSKRISSGQKVVVISGGARGADSLGERYAKERGLECKVFPADWDRYGKSAGYRRNVVMAEIGNACIAFLSGYSENKGTKSMISLARRSHLLVREVLDE